MIRWQAWLLALLILTCLMQPTVSLADAGLPVPPPGYQPGDPPPEQTTAEDDASAIEVSPTSESRELPADNGDGTALRPIEAQSAEMLEKHSTDVLNEAEAELASFRALLRDPAQFRAAGEEMPELPDIFTAGSIYTDKRGVVYGSGGVLLRLRSILPQGEAQVEADSASYDPESGGIELSGKVRFSLNGVDFSALAPETTGPAEGAEGSGFDPRYFSDQMGASPGRLSAGEGSLAFECDWLSVDPLMRDLQVRGLRLQLSLEDLLGSEAVKDLPLRTDFRNHLVPSAPRDVYLSSSQLHFLQSSRYTQLVLREVKISLGPRPDPDLYVTAREVELHEQQEVVFHGIQLHVSGFDWIRWPRLTRRLKSSPSPLSFDTPQMQIDREFGVAIKQGATVDLGAFKTDALVDYSPKYGVLAQTYAYLEPVGDTQIGLQAGRSTQSNIDRNTVQRRDDYNIIYRQSVSPGGQIDKLRLGAQYGHIHEKVAGRPNVGLPDRIAEDTRVMADMDMQLTPLELGGELYLTMGARARYIRYEEHDDDYTVVGGRAGLVWRHGDFDHFVLYRYNNTSGEPLFTFDEVRREQLDFATSVQTLPDWRNVFRGSYDPLEEQFDRLQLGTFKQQKSYELGLYWDFARESAEFEFGLLFD